MKIVVLDYKSLGEDLDLSPLKKYGEIEVFNGTTADLTAKRCENADIIVVNKVKITKEVIENSKNLKLVCEFATGYDNIDLVTAKTNGVAVCNVPAYSTDSVALITMATALSLCTHLRTYNDYVRTGEYTKSGVPNKLSPTYHELTGKTWGVLGCGNIGNKVAQIAEAMGMNVIVFKKHPGGKYRNVDIDTLCKESDILSIHCPLNNETRGIIDASKLKLMKKDAILINEARGAVTNESDIADAILSGKLGGFGADVYSVEPFPEDHPFQKIKNESNVLLTPHVAWGAIEARERCLKIICENIENFFAGKSVNRVE